MCNCLTIISAMNKCYNMPHRLVYAATATAEGELQPQVGRLLYQQHAADKKQEQHVSASHMGQL
jgi:hypothetical protein